MDTPILQPEEHVLTTLDRDGKRRWMKPKLAKGRFLLLRRVMAYGLIVLFTLLPVIHIGGKQALLLDIAQRRFTFFGFTFFPTDTLLLAIFGVGVLVSVFLMTSLFGRVWCGWACPQTVYMEFVFRPIERLFDGTAGRGGRPKKEIAPSLMFLRYLVYFIICFYLANTFLAYFVGSQTLMQWVQMSPLVNPVPFLIVAVVTFFMMFNFCFFREQLCILACPYGRFQSVLLDSHSMIIAYDKNRGEPRGRMQKVLDNSSDSALPVLGDCVDCKKCVTVCPTGIDIRDGLQMECIQCTQCIDTCDDVMRKTGREPGLIRYSSTHEIESGKKKLLRARVILYPVLLLVLISAFVGILLGKQDFTATVFRGTGNQFSITEQGEVRNQLRLKLINRTDEAAVYDIKLVGEQARLQTDYEQIEVEPGQMRTVDFSVIAPVENMKQGSLEIEIKIQSTNSKSQVIESFRMLGPLKKPGKQETSSKGKTTTTGK